MSLAYQTMGKGMRLGQAFGIPVEVNWTWLPVALLLTLTFTGVFATGFMGFVLAIIATLGLFASVLLHEFGHALTARRFGIRTTNITLHMLGGAANIERDPQTPRAEFLIAAAGPAVSFALGAGFWILATVSAIVAGPFTALWTFLSLANLVLAIFNLLPGLPLDGGRILRAYMWSKKKSRPQGTITAAKGGEFVGIGLMVWGVLSVLGIAVGASLMTAVLGWVLWSMAKRERVRAENEMKGIPEIGSVASLLLRFYRKSQGKRVEDDVEVIKFKDGREILRPKDTGPL